MLRPRFSAHFQPEKVKFATDRSYGVIPVQGHGGCARFLLVLSRKGHWAFPKGHADAGESDRQAALRELREETGISSISLLNWRKFEEHYEFVNKSGQPVRKTVVYYLGFLRQQPVVRLQAEEVADYRWCTAREAMQLITFEECRALFQEVLAFLDRYQG